MTDQTFLRSVDLNALRTDDEDSIAATTDESGGDNGGSNAVDRAQASGRAEKNLPTDRLALDKQVQALHVLAQLSGAGRRGVDAPMMSKAMNLSGATGGLSNKFFRDTGWVEATGKRGFYRASESLVEYYRRISIDPADTGGRELLAAQARGSWFLEEVQNILGAGILKKMLVLQLARAAGAEEHHLPKISILLEWIEWLGLIQTDGDMALPGTRLRTRPQVPAASAALDPEDTVKQASATTNVENTEMPEETPAVAAEPIDPAILKFDLSVHLTAADVERLDKDQLASLLALVERMRG